MKWTAKLALSTEQGMGKVVEGWDAEGGHRGSTRTPPSSPSVIFYTVDNQSKHEQYSAPSVVPPRKLANSQEGSKCTQGLPEERLKW